MNMKMKEFKTISFTPPEKRYYPASVDISSFDDGTYIKHTEMEIPLGQVKIRWPNCRFAKRRDLPKRNDFCRSTGPEPRLLHLMRNLGCQKQVNCYFLRMP